MTWIEVADSGMKIGLGAAIGILGQWLVHRYDAKNERTRRKDDCIERIADQFEENFIAQQVENERMFLPGAKPSTDRGEPSPAILGLRKLSSRLYLLGLKNCVVEVDRIIGFLTANLILGKAVSGAGRKPDASEAQDLERRAREINEARERFYEDLRRAY